MDEEQKEVFAARIERIQAKKAAQYGLPTPEELTEEEQAFIEDEFLPLPTERAGFGFVRFLFFVGTVFALAGFGAHAFLDWPGGQIDIEMARPIGIEPEDMPTLLEPERILAFGLTKQDQRRTGRRTTGERGWVHSLGSVATPDGASVRVDDIADGFDPEELDGRPRDLIRFRANAECSFRALKADEVVRNVRIDQGGFGTDIHALSLADMASAVLSHAQETLFEPDSTGVGAVADGRLRQVDVFVTDTSGPVYLVLQSLKGNTLWNVHRGQGVRLAHVVLMGRTSAVVLPSGITFEAVKVPAISPEFERSRAKSHGACHYAPFRKPKADWSLQNRATRGDTTAISQASLFQSGHDAFSDWYKNVMGVHSEVGLTEAETASHVLVGPMPPARLGYRQIGRHTAYIVEVEQIFESDDQVISAHRKLVLSAAGGDASVIKPVLQRAAE